MAARRNSDHRPRAEELLDMAEARGLEIDDYRQLMDDQPEFPQSVAVARRNQPDNPWREQFPRRGASERDPDYSRQQATQLRDQALLKNEVPDQIAMIEWAVQHARDAGEPLLIEELLRLLDHLASDEMPVSGYLALYAAVARQDLGSRQREELVSCYEALAGRFAQVDDRRSVDKCLNRAYQICDQYGLDTRKDGLRRKFDPDQSGSAGQFGIE